MSKTKWDDKFMERLLSNLLRRGIIFSSVIVCIGAAIFLWVAGTMKPQYTTFQGEPDTFKNVGQILASTLVPSGRGIIETGVLVLIMIPVIRVVLSIVSFAMEKDKFYVIITSVVLIFLMFSLFWQK